MYKQLIIVRRDLNMTIGKLAAQVSHASMAFLTNMIKCNTAQNVEINNIKYDYFCNVPIEKRLYENWINDSFTKIVCGARNKNKLLKAIDMAQEMGLKQGVDYFLIYDACRTELNPEEEDGTCLTCIGFTPMDASIIDQISKAYHLL